MEKVTEKEMKFRNGDSGPKYMIRGPNIDWGVFVIKPSQKMGAHGHNETEETFYFIQGKGKIIINDEEHDVVAGDAFRVEPQEKHDIENTATKENLKFVFIKCPYLPDDKIEYE